MSAKWHNFVLASMCSWQVSVVWSLKLFPFCSHYTIYLLDIAWRDGRQRRDEALEPPNLLTHGTLTAIGNIAV